MAKRECSLESVRESDKRMLEFAAYCAKELEAGHMKATPAEEFFEKYP